MPRIPPRDDMPIGKELPLVFSVMAHRPAIMESAQQLLNATMHQGSLDIQIKELVAVRVAQVNHCYY